MFMYIFEHFKDYTVCYLLLIYFIESAYSRRFNATYESGDHYKLFTIGESLELQCKPNNPLDGASIYWKKDESNVTDIIELKNRYELLPYEGKLIITTTKEEDAGSYSCNLMDGDEEESSPFEAIAITKVKISENSPFKEGKHIEINCTAKGTLPIIDWYYKPSKDEEYEKISEKQGVQIKTSIKSKALIFDQWKETDFGYYRCNSSNDLMGRRNIPDDSKEIEAFKDRDDESSLGTMIWVLIIIITVLLIILITLLIIKFWEKLKQIFFQIVEFFSSIFCGKKQDQERSEENQEFQSIN